MYHNLLNVLHIFVIKIAYLYVYHSPRDIRNFLYFCIYCTIFLHRFLVSHLADLVSKVDFKEIVGDSLIHSFRSVPTFRSCPQLLRLVVSIILNVSSFSVSPTFLETSCRMALIPLYSSRDIIVTFAFFPSYIQ